MKVALGAVLLWLLTMSQGQFSCWRGITPLRSTCDDVKKVLGIVKCSMPVTDYKVSEMEVTISFATGDCAKAPQGWRVPKGTVTSIIVSPRIPMTPEMFNLDISKYDKREDGEIAGLDHYTSAEDGVTVDMYAGVIQNLFLYPRKVDEVKRCKPN